MPRYALQNSFVRVTCAAGLLAIFTQLPVHASVSPDKSKRVIPPPGLTKLILTNGWKNVPEAAKASVSIVNGIVHFHGAIMTNGPSDFPFTMPAGFVPAETVDVPVDMCDATNGRLIIFTSGTVEVQAETNFSNAACFTSLDGVTFALSPDGFKLLKLQNGWKQYGNGFASAAVKNIGGILHFEGAIQTSGTNPVPFVLPVALRPTNTEYVKVDLCGASNGRLEIDPNGTVSVESENGFANAQCQTSLDGETAAVNSEGFTQLDLINGWTDYGDGSANAAVKVVGGIVQFEGAIATSGTNTDPFVLPPALRPAKEAWVPVDMCDATNGRLIIDPSGEVSVQAESDFSKAQCFTSLDGVSFHR